MKYNKRMTTREKVIKKQINDVREHLINVQLETEYFEECIKEIERMTAETEAKLKSLNVSEESNNEEYEKTLVKLLEDSRDSIKGFTDLIQERKSLENALVTKLNFFKRKREELATKEFANAVKSTPSTIKVNLDEVEFKEGPNK